jgi:hypothetical protein
MSKPRKTRKYFGLLSAAVVALLALGWTAATPAAAADLDKIDASLKLIPDNAAFYASTLRLGEQIQAVKNSRAWAKLMAMPIVKQGLTAFDQEAANPQSVPGQIKAALDNPDVKKLLALGEDMVSQEVYVYGDASCVEFIELLQQLMGTMRYGPIMAGMSARGRFMSEDKMMAMLVMATLCENADLLKAPDMVVGFKLKNPAAAKEHLAKLEALAGMALQHPQVPPELKGCIKRTKVGQHEYLVLSLDGGMVPWDELPIEELRDVEAEKGDADKLIARLKKMTLVVALGVRDEYLLAAIGSTTDCVGRLGTGKRLIDRGEFKPLAKYADRKLTSISYVSKAMKARVTTSKQDIDDLLDVGKELLAVAPFPPKYESLRGRLGKDAAVLAKDIKDLIPAAGAGMAFSFMTPEGFESFSYDWSEHPTLDGSKPLTLLQHVGGDPMLAVVGRGKVSVSGWDTFVKWVNVGYGYFEDYAVPEMKPKERKVYDEIIAKLKPLGKQIDKATRDMLIPALADGQAAFIIDTKLQSRKFIAVLGATENPLPMLEPAVVYGISDLRLLRKAIDEYAAVLNAFVGILAAQGVPLPPGFNIPKPEEFKADGGTIYGFRLPKDWGVDAQVMPNAGLAEKVGVLSISRGHTERLLKPTPLKAGGPLAKTDRPLAGAAVFNFVAFVDAATPWVDFATQQICKGSRIPADQQTEIAAQVHTVLDVLKVLRGAASVNYFEDGALVTHSRIEVRDIEK